MFFVGADNKGRLSRWLMALLCCIIIFVQVYYCLYSTTPQHWTPAYHSLNSIKYARDIAHNGPVVILNSWFSGTSNHLPVFYIANAPAYWIVGERIDTAQLWQTIYLVLTVLLIFKLGKVYLGCMRAVLAAFLYTCFPIVLGLARVVYPENLLVLEFMVFLIVLMNYHPFSRVLRTVLLGIIMGIGLMTSALFILYSMPALIIYTTIHQHEFRPKNQFDTIRMQAWGQVLLVVLLATGLCIFWYVGHLAFSGAGYHGEALMRAGVFAPPWKLHGLLFYGVAFPSELIGLPISTLLMISILAALLNKPRRNENLVWVLSFLCSLLLLSLLPYKKGCTIVPLLPLAALLLASTPSIYRAGIRSLVFAILVIISLLNATAQTIDLSRYFPPVRLPFLFGRKAYILRYGTPECILPVIQRWNWAIEEIVATIKTTALRERIEPSVSWSIDMGHPYLNRDTLTAYCHAKGLLKSPNMGGSNFYIFHGAPDKVLPDGTLGAERVFYLLGTWNLPDESDVHLYQCLPAYPSLALPVRIAANDSNIFFPGFSTPDIASGWRWTRTDQGRITFKLGAYPLEENPYILNLTCMGPGNQTAYVIFNGRPLGAMELGWTPVSKKFVLDREWLLPNAVNELVFKIADTSDLDQKCHNKWGMGFLNLNIEAQHSSVPNETRDY